jgi:hypothetical protein
MTVNEVSLMLPPLMPEIEALLAHERAIVETPDILRARLLGRARESLQVGGAGALESLRGAVRIPRLVLAAAAGIALIASAAAAYQLIKRPVPTLPASPKTHRSFQLEPLAPPAPEPESAPAPAAMPDKSSAATPAPSASAAIHRVVPPRRDDNAIKELRLLERARQSDSRGDFASVLTFANDHEHSFPDGRLVEEREVLRVKALVALGRSGEARAVAARFRREFPRSVLLPKIEKMLASLR